MDEWLTIKMSAELVRVPERTMYYLIKEKRGPKAYRFSNKHIRIKTSDLGKWIAENEM